MLVLDNKSENNILVNINNEYNYWCIDLSNDVQNQINFKETMTDKSTLILPVPNKNFKTSSNLNFTVNTRFLITYNKYLKKIY